jgi:acetylglutamate kinase
VACQHCNAHFSVVHGGRSDINQHLCSQKHKDAEKTLVRRDSDSERDKIAAFQQVKLLLLVTLCVTAKVFAQMTACGH